ncbi:hypothetical protein FRC07_007399 [Ceratobasidium sp. 392]|nr:hypothetical protein FRC07_007399 [Ceratobasidium sp. 392]
MQTGQTSTETLLNGPRGHGALAGLNMADLFGGANPTDPNMMQSMLSSPQFLEQMSRMMSDPNLMDTLLAQNPQLQQMDPQLRATFQSEQFRNMISNPDTLRNMMQMTAALRQAGIDPMGGLNGMAGMSGGMGGFPPPFGGLGGAGLGAGARGANPAPSGNLFEQAATGATTATTPGAGTGTTGTGATANPTSPTGSANPTSPGAAAGGFGGGNPFGMIDPALIQQILGGQGGFGSQGTAAGGNPFAALSGFGSPPPPADTRPVEERFQVQLQQLQDMGFTNAQQNIRALLACGGRVDSAIEYILGGGGI